MPVTSLTPAGASVQHKVAVVTEQTQEAIFEIKAGSRPLWIVVGCSGNTVAGTLDVGLADGTGNEFISAFACAPGAGTASIGTTEALDFSKPLRISATLTGAGAGPVQISLLYTDLNLPT